MRRQVRDRNFFSLSAVHTNTPDVKPHGTWMRIKRTHPPRLDERRSGRAPADAPLSGPSAKRAVTFANDLPYGPAVMNGSMRPFHLPFSHSMASAPLTTSDPCS